MRHVALLLLLLLAACATTPAGNGTSDQPGQPGKEEIGEEEAGLAGLRKFKHTEQEARQFIRRYDGLSVGLVNYIDPGRTELISREFTGETVVFRLDNCGDTGPLWEAAASRAGEMVTEYGWPLVEAGNEYAHETHIALVKLESMGIPAGSRAGDLIPVRAIMVGNASDIRGGYIYNTPLKNKLGKTVAILKQGYLPLPPEKAVSEEQKRESRLAERREGAGRVSFVLRAAAVLAANIRDDELTADQIIMPLTREVSPGSREFFRTMSAELVAQVIPQIEDLMAKSKPEPLPCRAHQQGDNLVITPLGVRETSLRMIFERLQTLRVKIEPRSNVIVVFDEAIVRVAIYGLPRYRFMIRDVAMTTDPFTRNKENVKPQLLRFRVNCRVLRRADPGTSRQYGVPTAQDLQRGVKPDGDKGRVRLAWSRWTEKGDMEKDGVDELETTDISEVLRFLWTKQMKPAEVLAFVLEAHDSLAISCELGFNWRKVDVDAMRREMEDDQRNR
ncbi:MAG: hypothetical protein IPP14_05190 [Planctomycetes bacterium]|nr:hypothetical protein [Planctomycetota bacterium]